MAVIFFVCSAHIHAQRPLIKRIVFRHTNTDFSFAHITDTHIGEGAPKGDYGTQGFYDTLIGNESGYPLHRLQMVVQWLQQHAKNLNIRLVIFSGDLTDSGEKSEFLRFRQTASLLNIPYIPLIGNHDVWSYNYYGKEDDRARGDSLMNEIFAPAFENIAEPFVWIADNRNNIWYDLESKSICYLQNFVLQYDNLRWIFLDFNPRYHVRKPEPGIGPEAQLHEGENGTLDFLSNALADANNHSKKVFLVSHHPPLWSLIGKKHAFSAKEKRTLAKILRPYRKIILGWLAGHIHRNATYRFTRAKGIRVIETGANKSKKNGCLRIIRLKRN
ncbi:MAG: metallophosphoesterase [Chitinophagales bacterium]|nr:metallophosphoesterase [Chitinophagales bacterium]